VKNILPVFSRFIDQLVGRATGRSTRTPTRGRHIAAGVGALLAVLSAAAPRAQADENVIAAAHDAFLRHDNAALERYATATRGTLLEDYPQFWLLDSRLNGSARDVDAAEVRAFFGRYPDGPVADRLRTDWLRYLARGGDWDAYNAELPKLPNPDLELTCFGLDQRLRHQDTGALHDARALWFTPKSVPDACNQMFLRLGGLGMITTEDAWTRLRLATVAGNLAATKDILPFLPPDQAPTSKQFDKALANPHKYLDKPPLSLRYRAGREVAAFAILRLASKDIVSAGSRWASIAPQYPAREQAAIWGELAYAAAMGHEPMALEWYRRAKDAPLGVPQLAWWVRVGLRAQAWPEVLAAIERMPEQEAADAAWRYWKGRALKAMGRPAEAVALFASLAQEPSFYGLLAADELGTPAPWPSDEWKPVPEDVFALAGQRGIARAMELYRSGLLPESVREWNFAIRGFDDRQLLTAAEVARRAGWYERAINTADRTVSLHDYSLRYPLPYREAIEQQARQNQLDAAWLFGLVRQESRFLPDARSRSGAMGLMQLMPETAKWIAKRLGWKGFQTDSAGDVDTNVALGSYYLRYVLDDLGHPMLATAAYNAGPNRARKWVGGNALEGAIFAESIPIQETRDYVKKVMSNTALYAAQYQSKLKSFKQMLGYIGGRQVAASDASHPGHD
jgi:soluble lytic murein transglycosylase